MCIEHRPLICDAIAALVSAQSDMRFVASVATLAQAVRLYNDARPDVVLIDAAFSQLTGDGDVVSALRTEDPDVRLVAFALNETDEIRLPPGVAVHAVVLPSMAGRDLVRTIRGVYRGERQAGSSGVQDRRASLTGRELDVLRQIATGQRTTEVAAQLGIGPETVKGHVRNILVKLAARSRAQAVAIALGRGLFKR
jgi:DNA-binding NarL/FixJ family response regulator